MYYIVDNTVVLTIVVGIQYPARVLVCTLRSKPSRRIQQPCVGMYVIAVPLVHSMVSLL
jgi:hypothetical protein